MERLPLPLGLSYPTVNAYLFTEPEPVLVDCGMNTPETLAALEAGLAAQGLSTKDLAKVVITHPHVDHVGLAGVLAEGGAEVWMAPQALEWLSAIDTRRAESIDLHDRLLAEYGFDAETRGWVRDFYGMLTPFFSRVPAGKLHAFPIDGRIEFGGTTWEVLPAPGHSNLQVCFYQAETRRLLAADMLLPRAPVPVIEPRLDDPAVRSEGLPELLTSFARFRELDVEAVYPGHGDPFSGHQALIDRQVDRIRQRCAECRDLVAGGLQTLPELLPVMYRYLPAHERLAGLAMLVGYLDVLVAENEVRVLDGGMFEPTYL